MNDNTPGVTPANLKLHERVAALEAVQERHDEDITKLSNKIDSLADKLMDCTATLSREQHAGIAAIQKDIAQINSGRSRALYVAITGGGAVGGSIAYGLYELVHTLYPHFFGG